MRGFALHFFFLFANTAVFFPYSPLFLRARGFSHAQVGLLLGVLRFAGIAGPLLIGGMADRTRRYRLLLQLSLTVSVLFMVPLQFLGSAWAFVPFLVFIGAGYGALIPLSDALANGSCRTRSTATAGSVFSAAWASSCARWRCSCSG